MSFRSGRCGCSPALAAQVQVSRKPARRKEVVMLFSLIKWIHVLSAITAVGANITYGIWIARASREPKVLPFVLRNIKLIDDRLANPAYGLLLLTGLAMAFLGPIPLTTPWLLT